MVVSTHKSSLDPIVQLRALPVSLRVLAMRELFRMPLSTSGLTREHVARLREPGPGCHPHIPP
jgi:hypothetical protein